jgi:undecaprenyl-diphosphatase
MNELEAAAILGAVQGLTEFLPVSSTAHLILVTDLLKLDPNRFGLTFDVALHLGTALAVLVYFAGTWLSLLWDVVRLRWGLFTLLVLGSLPAAIAGAIFQSSVETNLRGPVVIVIGLVVGSVAIAIAETRARQRRYLGDVGFGEALFIGLAQAVALVPGISRSGITISAGLVRDLHREEATRFSFLLATPIIVGAGAKTLLDARRAAELFAFTEAVAVGFVVAFISGFAAIAFMMSFLRSHSLSWFIGYRLALAAAILILLRIGVLSP